MKEVHLPREGWEGESKWSGGRDVREWSLLAGNQTFTGTGSACSLTGQWGSTLCRDQGDTGVWGGGWGVIATLGWWYCGDGHRLLGTATVEERRGLTHREREGGGGGEREQVDESKIEKYWYVYLVLAAFIFSPTSTMHFFYAGLTLKPLKTVLFHYKNSRKWDQ